jgi:hypothetical protein
VIDDDSDDDSDDDKPNDGSNNALVFYTERDVFRNRQRHVERIKENCDFLYDFTLNPPDTDQTGDYTPDTDQSGDPPDADQSGDYTREAVGEKRSFGEFIDQQLNEIDKPIIAANDILSEMMKHRTMLRRTKKNLL